VSHVPKVSFQQSTGLQIEKVACTKKTEVEESFLKNEANMANQNTAKRELGEAKPNHEKLCIASTSKDFFSGFLRWVS